MGDIMNYSSTTLQELRYRLKRKRGLICLGFITLICLAALGAEREAVFVGPVIAVSMLLLLFRLIITPSNTYMARNHQHGNNHRYPQDENINCINVQIPEIIPKGTEWHREIINPEGQVIQIGARIRPKEHCNSPYESDYEEAYARDGWG